MIIVLPPLSPISESNTLTTQLSRTSIISMTSMESTLSRDIETKLFDDTLNVAYKSSTFQRCVSMCISHIFGCIVYNEYLCM